MLLKTIKKDKLMKRERIMKIKTLITICFLLPLLSFANQNGQSFEEYKAELQSKLNEKSQALNTCRSECKEQHSNYSSYKCDNNFCSSQKSAFDQVRNELDRINMSAQTVNNKSSILSRAESNLNSCISRCKKTLTTNNTDEHCRDVVCAAYKKTYENLVAHSNNIDKNKDKAEEDTDSTTESSQSAKNQVEKARNKVNALAYVAAGTTAYLGYKAAMCFSSCPKGPCCPQAGMFAGMAALGAVQTSKMFKSRSKLNQTCQDLSSNGVCTTDNPNGLSNPDQPIPPDPLPPGCEHNPEFCENPNILPVDAWPSDGTSPSLDKLPLASIVSDKLKKDWTDENNPFKDANKFSYEDLSKDQKKSLDNAMKGLNQKKQDYMDQNGLFGDDLMNALNSKDVDAKGKKGKNGVDDEAGEEFAFDSPYANLKEAAGSFAANSLKQRRKRKNKSSNDDTMDKMKEMLKKMRGGRDRSTANVEAKSVSIGNDYVGVREDNIFLMVHRLNRKLDEKEKRFIVDF